MKKIICSIMTLLLIACLSISALAENAQGRVYDYCGYLSAEETQELEARIDRLVEKTGLDFVVVITGDKSGKSLEEYSDDFYDEGGFGVGDDNSGLLMLIDMEERTVYVSTCGEAILYFNDDRIYDLTDGNDALYEDLSEGDYDDAIGTVIEDVEYYHSKGIPSNQYTYDKETGKVVRHKSLTLLEILLSLAVAAVIVITNVKTVKAQYGMKKEKKMASGFRYAYRVAANYAFALATDNLVSHRTTTRIIPRNTSSGGSSSGQSTIHTSGG